LTGGANCRAAFATLAAARSRGAGNAGKPFAEAVHHLSGASAQVAKHNELHIFAVIPRRWLIERSFSWLEKNRRLWKNTERFLNTGLQLINLALLLRRL
jgi:transposase